MKEVAAELSRHVNEHALTDMLRTLVGIPSVTGAEDQAQEHIASFLRHLGAEVDAWRLDVAALRRDPRFPGARITGSRLNVVGKFPSTGAAPTLILNGHIDTVDPGEEDQWTYPPFGAEIVGGKLYGRGACDMKGGIVSILGALQAIRSSGLRLRGSICVQSVVGEEDGGLGTFAALTRGHRGDAVIVCEPTDLQITPAQAGVAVFKLMVRGRTAHAAVRNEGVSAFEKFLIIHQALMRLEQARNRKVRHPLYEGIAVPWAINLGVVNAGHWASTVPGKLVTEGRMGVAIGEEIANARREFEEAVQGVCAGEPWLSEHPPTIEWLGGEASTEMPIEHPLIRTLAQAIQAVTGRQPAVRGATYGSDLRLFTNDFGVPGVLFGPGDIRVAHATDEHVLMGDVRAAALTLACAIVQFCGTV